MRVTIVSCVFPPEPVVSSRTSLHVAQGLAGRGHQVTVVTAFPSKPAGRGYPGFARRLIAREKNGNGFAVRRCFSTFSSRSRLLSRFLENFTFGLSSGMAVLLMRRPDVLYVNTWPIVAGGLVFLAAKLRRVPMVVSIQDVYPESLFAQGHLSETSILGKGLRWMDGVIARGCRAVIVISERFAAIYREQRRVAGARIHVVPNWADDLQPETDAERLSRFRERLEIPPRARIFAYGGNVGTAAGVENLIQAVRLLPAGDRFHLLIAGEGSRLEHCRALAEETACRDVTFHAPWRSDETALVLGLAEVLLLPTQGRQSYASVPSKLVSYWLAGRPVIAQACPGSSLADVLEKAGGGWLVAPGRPELLAAKIREVLEMNAAEVRRRGEAGRHFALRNLTRAACLPRVLDVMEKAVSR
ncbi:MAG: glycosyltransferase family 4 protein [Candidatus Aminicenantes bacterium]|nr:glycosyltransferase family 4 protein [Candidatus Aminicenantes bacterium]